MATLLIAEHDNLLLSEQTGKALSAALQIDADVDILVAGKNARSVADAAAGLRGVRKVLLAESEKLAERLAEPLAQTLLSLAGLYETFVAPATSTGKSVMPRLSALLDVSQVSEIVEVVSAETFKRPIYAGNAVQTVQAPGAWKVITVRTASFPSASQGDAAAAVESISAAACPEVSSWIENVLSKSERPDLSSARIIVAGGRALGSFEKFQEVVLPLADKLGAAVGASRAAVDAGYADRKSVV